MWGRGGSARKNSKSQQNFAEMAIAVVTKIKSRDML